MGLYGLRWRPDSFFHDPRGRRLPELHWLGVVTSEDSSDVTEVHGARVLEQPDNR